MVARAAPDGYTLLAAISTITIEPSMQKNLPFDPVRDLAPVSVFVRLPNVLVGHPSLQPKNVRELIAFAKARTAGQFSRVSRRRAPEATCTCAWRCFSTWPG